MRTVLRAVTVSIAVGVVLPAIVRAQNPSAPTARAVDARTGRPFWEYRRTLPTNLTYGALAPVNRGFAILGELLYMTTLDAHLIALDRRTGGVVWDVRLADYRQGYAATLAPLVVDDQVIVGIGGGEYATRGFLDSYDAATGARRWRLFTVPGP